MKREFNIVGLDCGHCALTLEKYLEKVKGVKYCSVNFSTSKLFLEIDDDDSKIILKQVFKTAKSVNPDVKITQEKENDNNINVYDITLYVFGVIIGIFVLFLSMDKWLYYCFLTVAALLMGYRTFYKALLQLRHIRINENTLITLSILGAILIGESMEGLMVIALYTLGKFLESRAVNFSRKSIASLIATRPDFAIVIRDGKEVKVKPEDVKLEEIIVVRSGDKIPLDGIVVDGIASIDKKHLTGESVPVVVNKDDVIESGCLVLDSILKIKVTTLYKDSTVSKILDMVANASNNKSKTETLISKISNWYTLAVVICSVVVFGLTYIILKDVSISIYRGLIFLVVSCPCAFAISVPLAYFSGLGRSSREGILIKGSNVIDNCCKIDTVVFDKTGTLTLGSFQVCRIETKKNITEEFLLNIVVAGEKNSAHPIAKAICDYHQNNDKIIIKEFKDVIGKGIEYKVGEKTYFVGREDTRTDKTVIGVFENKKLIGKIHLEDKIKDEATQVIQALKSNKIKTIMLTGDNKKVAKSVAKKLGIDEYRAELLPADKYNIIDQLKKSGKVAVVGDGLNDAPALTLADVGISMGIMGSSATIETSDVVISNDNLLQINNMIKISRKTRSVVLQNIIFAAATKLTFLLLGALGLSNMLLAVFADVGVTLIAILNSLRVLKK